MHVEAQCGEGPLQVVRDHGHDVLLGSRVRSGGIDCTLELVHLQALSEKLDPPANLGAEHLGIEGLWKSVDLAGDSVHPRQLGDVDVIVRRNEENRRAHGPWILSNERGGGESIEPRHAHVHDDGCEYRVATPLDGCEARLGSYDATIRGSSSASSATRLLGLSSTTRISGQLGNGSCSPLMVFDPPSLLTQRRASRQRYDDGVGLPVGKASVKTLAGTLVGWIAKRVVDPDSLPASPRRPKMPDSETIVRYVLN
jgi:hypothetical protein